MKIGEQPRHCKVVSKRIGDGSGQQVVSGEVEVNVFIEPNGVGEPITVRILEELLSIDQSEPRSAEFRRRLANQAVDARVRAKSQRVQVAGLRETLTGLAALPQRSETLAQVK